MFRQIGNPGAYMITIVIKNIRTYHFLVKTKVAFTIIFVCRNDFFVEMAFLTLLAQTATTIAVPVK